MQVQRYLFQSPSPSPVQVGRPDTSLSKEDTSSETEKEKTVENSQETSELQAQKTQKLNVQSPNNILDLYV